MMTKGGPKSHKIDDVFYEWPQKGKTRYHLLMTKKSSKVGSFLKFFCYEENTAA